MRRRLSHPIAILCVYTLLTLLLTYPLTFNLTNSVPNDIGDPLLNTWILAWDVHAMLTDPRQFFEANIFYPLPQTLAYSEHLFSTAILSLPLQFYDPLLAYNFSLLISFPLGAWGMYLLTLHWTRHRQAAFIAGFIFAFAPYRFAAIAHLQLLTFQWLPFTLLCLSQLTGQRPIFRQPFFYLSLMFGLLQILACWYLAVYMLICLIIFELMRFSVRQDLFKLRANIIITISVMLLFVLPWAYPYIRLMPTLRQARPLESALMLASQLTDFLAAAPFNTFFGTVMARFRDRPDFTEENTLFLGFIAPILALCALRSRQWGLWLILLVTLALTFAWPYATLAQIIPASTVIRVPPRWIIPALFALSGLAGFGYTNVLAEITKKTNNPKKVQRFIFMGILTGLLLESLSMPLPLAEVDNQAQLNPAYHWLAQQPPGFALLELPMYQSPEYPEVKRLYASTLGWWKLINGYSGYTPPRQPALAQAMTHFPDETALTALDPFVTNLPLYILIHPGEINRTQWEDTLRWQAEQEPRLKPLGQFEGDYLYQFIPPQPQDMPMARFANGLELLHVERITMTPNSPSLLLHWRATSPLTTNLTVFIHLRAADGFVRGQADGLPVSGHNPMTTWQVGQIIQDVHVLPLLEYNHLAMGLYDPATNLRLSATTLDGQTDVITIKP